MMENTTLEADWFSCPGDSVVAAMQRRGITPSALAERLSGGMQQLRDLVSGAEGINEQSASVIGEVVGGSAGFWLKRQQNYEIALDKAVSAVSPEDALIWLAVPAPGPNAKGRLDEVKRRNELRRRLAFFAVSTIGAWHARYGREREQTRFRKSTSLASDDGATSMWLRQAELAATLAETGHWNPEALKERLRNIKQLSRISQPKRFLPQLRRLLAEAGVALVIQRAPKGCKASGASRMITPERAMILLSFRFRSDEQFWFTLFHEIGHLLLHGEQSFVDSDDMPDDECEREANEFAASMVVPDHAKGEFDRLAVNYKDIARFAVAMEVSPGLVRGQLEHRGRIDRGRFAFLRRTWQWSEIDEAIASL